ncbi:MAG: hypothetical protein RIM23_04725 [Coleofasciculus sp. G3-WIS-01]|uniref:hypothetical protein n=1 Tax=Coleofasciculus sp. G3-WIS-01 TaxID=3069528 RepID=UPI003303EE97
MERLEHIGRAVERLEHIRFSHLWVKLETIRVKPSPTPDFHGMWRNASIDYVGAGF